MLLSMTGYGRVSKEYENKVIHIEVRSLNSKFLDLKIKMPQNYREKEIEIRKQVTSALGRGKVDLSIDIESEFGKEKYSINKKLFTALYTELSSIKSDLNIENGDMFQSILRVPNVVSVNEEPVDEEEWGQLKEVLEEALSKLTEFRKTEGDSLKSDFFIRLDNIQNSLTKIPPFEAARMEKMKGRIKQNLEDNNVKSAVDENRFEQEILYYLEKMDITEEKVRLKQHCLYFKEELEKSIPIKGKKLNFITQEMGREINTIGSKANSSDIQRIVVEMKDDLEKMKEQMANIL